MKEEVLKEAAEKSSVPDLEYIVHNVRNSQHWDFSTKEGLCAYQNAVVNALHAEDSNFGQLAKTEGQNHCVDTLGRNCATDVALYRPTGQIIDFIQSAGYDFPPDTDYEDQNAVTWQVGPVGEYTEDMWFAPDGSTETDGGSEGGGEVPQEVLDQLNRMEQKIIQMELFMSNMNEQIALMGGVINQLYAETIVAGPQVRDGQELVLQRRA